MKTALFRSRPVLLIPLLLIAAMLLLSANADAVSAILQSRITFCLTSLIPSLYGCMALGNLLCLSGAGAVLGCRFRRTAAFFRMEPPVFGIFLISQFAGYPVGAALLRQAADHRELPEKDAAALSAVCYGGGPAFLIGFAGKQLSGSTEAGICMMLSCMLANGILAGLLLRNRSGGKSNAVCAYTYKLNARTLTDSVTQAMKGLAQICAAVLLFGIFQYFLECAGAAGAAAAFGSAFGIPAHVTRALLACALDITQLPALFVCGLPRGILLPLAAGLLSFGGFCVQLQCLALGVRSLHSGRLLAVRLLAALLAASLTAAAVPLLPVPEETVVSAFANRAVSSETGSFLPAFLIFLTGFPFLLKKD